MIINRIFILSYILVILTPAFRVLDIIAAQSLYLNVLNFLSTSYIIYLLYFKKDRLKTSGFANHNILVFSFFLFFLWSSITVFWSINKSEAFRTLSEIFTFILAFSNIIYHLKNLKGDKLKFIFFALFLMQIVEISFLVFDYLKDVSKGIFTPGSMRYLGLTGNKNIASFSILIKVPILIYFLIRTRVHKFWKLISFIYLFLSSYSIFYITLTRGAQIAYILLIIFFIFFELYSTFIIKEKLSNPIKNIGRLIIPVVLAIIIGNLHSINKTSINENISSAFQNVDSSSNERLRFYKYALEIIKDNFLTGTGIGSWELESIEKDRLEMRSYVVPYHVHNDFLEIFSETGLFGFLFFYGPILIIYFLLFKNLFYHKIDNTKTLVLFLMFSMYLADALINFPFARVIQNINLIFILVCSLYILEEKHNNWIINKYYSFFKLRTILLIMFIISPLGIYSSIRQFSSSRDQVNLLFAFNSNNFKMYSKDELEKIERVYPDLTLTTLPISTIIGLHYYENNELDEAENYFREGIKANPYLNVNQSYIGKIYAKKGNLDSAKYYTKYAFDKMPNNPVHFAHYLQVLIKEYDTVAIKDAYEKVIYKERDSKFEELYLLAMSNLLDKDEGKLVLNSINKNQLKGDGLKASYFILELGKERVLEGYVNYAKAEKLFELGEFEKAASFYEKAFEKNPLEYPYIENASISYLKLGDLDKALDRINIVIDNMDIDNLNGKTYYIKGLIYLEKDERKKACVEFENALKAGFNTNLVLSSYCR